MHKFVRWVWVFLGCLCLLSLSCTKGPQDLEEVGAGLASTPADGLAFYVPTDPPSAEYTIEASCSLGNKGIQLKGHSTIELKNSTQRPISVVALRWPSNPDDTKTVSVKGAMLKKHAQQPSHPIWEAQ